MSKKSAYELVLGGVVKATKDVEHLADNLTRLEKELANEAKGTLKFERLQKEIELVDLESQKAQKQLEKFNNVKFDNINKSFSGVKMNFKDISALATGGASSIGIMTSATSALGVESSFLTGLLAKFGDTSKIAFAAAASGSTKFTTALKMGLISTGLGAFVVIVGSLLAYFKKTQEGSDKLSSGMAYLGGLVQGVANLIIKLGKGIFDLVSNFDKVYTAVEKFGDEITGYFKKVIESPKILLDDLMNFVVKKFGILGKIIEGALNLDTKAMANGVIEFYTGVEGGTAKLGNVIDKAANAVKRIGNELLDAGGRAKKLEDATQAFDKLKNATELEINALQRLKAADEVVINSTMKGQKEREAAAKSLAVVEEKIFAKKETLLEKEHALIKFSNTLADTGREDAHKEALALDAITANKEEAARRSIELAQISAEITKSYARVKRAETKADLEAVIDANQQRLESDRLTFAERLVIMDASAKKQKELLSLQLAELKTLGKMPETLKQIADTERALGRVDSDNRKAKLKLESEFVKSNDNALLREQRAIIERKKLASEHIKIEIGTYDELKTHTETELSELLAIIDTKGSEKLRLIKDINEDEIREEIKRHLKYISDKALSDEEIRAAEEEHQLKLEQLQKDLGDKEVAVAKEVSEKKKNIRKADADAHRKKLDDEADALAKQFELYQKIFRYFADGIHTMTDLLVDASVKAFESKLQVVDGMLKNYADRAKAVDDMINKSKSDMDALEARLMTARGGERDIIIQKLEDERKKQKQLAQDRKTEDDRIKKAEKEKVMLAKEKEKAIAKQVVVTQTLAIVSQLVTNQEAIQAALKASKGGKVGWDNLAILFAMTASIIASISAIGTASKKGFAAGGFTGGGKGAPDETGYRVAGVVHENEYVAPKWMIEQNPDLFAELEKMRLSKTGYRSYSNKFAAGGFTTPNMIATQSAEQVSATDIALINRMDALIQANEMYANRPIIVDAVEVVNTANRTVTYSEYSLK
jgi:hypothetical protein